MTLRLFVAYRSLGEFDRQRKDDNGNPISQASITYPVAEVDRSIPVKISQEAKKYLPAQPTLTDSIKDIEAGLCASYMEGVLIKRRDSFDPNPIFDIYLEDGDIRKSLPPETVAFIEGDARDFLGVRSKDEFAKTDKEYRKRMVKEVAKFCKIS